MASIAIKLTIVRDDTTEVRRISGSFTFDELVSGIQHMWNSAPKHMLVEYVDDEGDRVRVAAQSEWEEAQRLFRESGDRTLKLFARRRPPVQGTAGGMSRSATGDTATSRSEGREPSTPTVTLLPIHDPRCVLPLVAFIIGGEDPDPIVRDPANALAEKLLERVSDDSGRLSVLPRDALRDFSINVVRAKLEEGEQGDVLDVLRRCNELWPLRADVPYLVAAYRAARCEADAAIAALGTAIECGFGDTATLATDPLLDNVRYTPEFEDFMATLTGQRDDSGDDGFGGEAKRERHVDPVVQQVLEIVPSISAGEAAAALAAHGYDATAAVNYLLRQTGALPPPQEPAVAWVPTSQPAAHATPNNPPRKPKRAKGGKGNKRRR